MFLLFIQYNLSKVFIVFPPSSWTVKQKRSRLPNGLFELCAPVTIILLSSSEIVHPFSLDYSDNIDVIPFLYIVQEIIILSLIFALFRKYLRDGTIERTLTWYVATLKKTSKLYLQNIFSFSCSLLY